MVICLILEMLLPFVILCCQFFMSVENQCHIIFNFYKLIFVVLITGGIAETPCPYRCISERYHMPHCYTALEELIYTFGGPWLFCLLLVGLLILLALVLSVARMKFVGVDELPGPAPTQHGSQIDHSFPFLESLNEVNSMAYDLLYQGRIYL